MTGLRDREQAEVDELCEAIIDGDVERAFELLPSLLPHRHIRSAAQVRTIMACRGVARFADEIARA